ncbi:MAG TPA: site-specific DNA-methyltransferase [Candidatus Angelobacter sp.]|jgi:site-specific DNA-methyltransferase (cytosine-N4-specific)|nr:site-specific DNA-methyltransferase [Candidatus Angelobacter sp.]
MAVNQLRSDAPIAEIRRGDAFDLIQDVPTGSVDLILTSPPYWGLRSYGLTAGQDVLRGWLSSGCSAARTPPYDWYRDAGGVLGLEPYPHWYVDHLVEFFNRARDALVDASSVWINLGDTYFARWSSIRDGGRQGFKAQRQRRRTPSGGYLQDKQLLLIPARFAIAMQDAGWILRNDVIWAKPRVMPRPEPDRLKLSHEHWFHFVKPRPRGRAAYYYDLTFAEDGHRDVVVCSTVRGAEGHTATFPPELIAPRIGSSCPPEGLVLDPFCGTGRTIIESLRLGRRGLGFELSTTFAGAARAELRKLQRDASRRLDVLSPANSG